MQFSSLLQRFKHHQGHNVAGSLFAVALLGASLSPSMMPRSPVMQGLLGGICAAIGFGLGLLAFRLWLFLELPKAREFWLTKLRWVGYTVAILFALYCLWMSDTWQNATRVAIGLQPVDARYPLTTGAVVLVTFAVIWSAGKLFAMLWRFVDRKTERILPPRPRIVLALGFTLWLVWALVDGFVVRAAFHFADSVYEAADRLVQPYIARPTDPLKTGSEASLIHWEDLGRWGRDYINRAPTRQEISEFVPSGAMEPIRVYVGLGAAETSNERAALALRELLRVGAFNRSYLVVMVPVGTGWMDPGGQDTLEFMTGGNVATVAVQYSYLRGAWSVAADSERGREQGQALLDVIYGYWSKLPRERRPKLYLHGLSQGAFISQQTLRLSDMLADPIQGALWVGSPFFSPLWRQIRDTRQPTSPSWKPIYGNSSLARTGNQDGGFDIPGRQWGPVRFAFLNYGSDPIVAFNYGSAYQQPDWMKAPRPPDISPELRWLPIVTMLQIALDTGISLNVPGYGHYYIAPHYIDAWAAVLDLSDWNEQKAKNLKSIFAARAPAF